MGRVDELRGFKENVILGHLIPGGTGFPLHRYLKLVPLCETISDEEMDKLRAEAKAKQDAIFGKVPPSDEEDEDDGEGKEAFAVVSPEATPEAFAAEAASEEAARMEDAEAGYGFDE